MTRLDASSPLLILEDMFSIPIRRIIALLLPGTLLVLAACSPKVVGVPASENKPIVLYPGDSRAHYRDDESSHVITLMADGTYIFESADMYGGPVSSREGRWKWKRNGTHKAELTLDTNVWILSFVGQTSAIAVNTSASGRTFAFQFERF